VLGGGRVGGFGGALWGCPAAGVDDRGAEHHARDTDRKKSSHAICLSCVTHVSSVPGGPRPSSAPSPASRGGRCTAFLPRSDPPTSRRLTDRGSLDLRRNCRTRRSR